MGHPVHHIRRRRALIGNRNTRLCKSRHLRLIVVAVLITVVGTGTFGITHWVVSRSDAYAAADRHLRISTEFAAIMGPVKAKRLSWLEHTAVEELEINGRLSGNAEFTVIAEGNSG